MNKDCCQDFTERVDKKVYYYDNWGKCWYFYYVVNVKLGHILPTKINFCPSCGAKLG